MACSDLQQKHKHVLLQWGTPFRQVGSLSALNRSFQWIVILTWMSLPAARSIEEQALSDLMEW